MYFYTHIEKNGGKRNGQKKNTGRSKMRADSRAAEQGKRYGHGGYPDAVQGNDSGVPGGQP